MTATLDAVASKKKPEPSAEQKAAEEPVCRAREQGLSLPGVTGLVIDSAQRVLLVRRADNHRWTLITGFLEPGEQPAAGIVREILEETGVTASVLRVLAVQATNPATHPNGDQTVSMDVAFACTPTAGTAHVNDDESTNVGWFPITELPDIPERHKACVKRYLDGVETT